MAWRSFLASRCTIGGRGGAAGRARLDAGADRAAALEADFLLRTEQPVAAARLLLLATQALALLLFLRQAALLLFSCELAARRRVLRARGRPCHDERRGGRGHVERLQEATGVPGLLTSCTLEACGPLSPSSGLKRTSAPIERR